MNITRSQSFILAAAGLLLFFGVGILVSHRSSNSVVESQSDSGSAVENPEEPEAASRFVLNDFNRSETKDGKKLWEIHAKVGEYSPETNIARLQSAEIFYYKTAEDTVRLTADHGRIVLKGPSLQEAEIEGNVNISLEQRKISLKTSNATFNKDLNTVSAPGFVEMHGELFDLSGNSLKADLASKTFVLEDNVKSVMRGGKIGK